MLPEVKKGDRVLEIGPSMTSCIIKELTHATVETLCIDDLNRNFLDPLNMPLHRCDITREIPPLPKDSYDLILFCEVLEHFLFSTKVPYYAHIREPVCDEAKTWWELAGGKIQKTGFNNYDETRCYHNCSGQPGSLKSGIGRAWRMCGFL